MVDKFNEFKKLTPEDQKDIEEQVAIVERTLKKKNTTLPLTENDLTVNFSAKPRINKNDY